MKTLIKFSKESTMKNTSKFLALAIALVITSVSAFACEIEIDIVKGKKATYSKGDILTLKVEVENTHRSCIKEIEDVQLIPKNLEILSSTGWNDKDEGTEWEKKVKVKVTGKKGDASFTAKRVCSKQGGEDVLVLKIK